MIGIGTIIITAQQSEISQKQHESDLQSANTQLQESILSTFRDDINHLLLDEQLRNTTHGDPVQVIAQSYANDALRRLNLDRKTLLIQFLADLHLVTTDHQQYPIISLQKLHLSGAHLVGIDLAGADLTGADLSNTDLTEADLIGAHLVGANLSRVRLVGADLSNAALLNANLTEADLSSPGLVFDTNEAGLSHSTYEFTMIAPDQLDQTWSLSGARLPDGTRCTTVRNPDDQSEQFRLRDACVLIYSPFYYGLLSW
jgi:uncharacterized protein YjbI with pentapeptide repeats